MNTGIAHITTQLNDIPAISTTLWYSGCKLSCSGCQNTSLEGFKDGMKLESVKQTLSDRRDLTDWLVFLGGNPLDSIQSLLEVSNYGKKLGYKQFLYTGYDFITFSRMFDEYTHAELLNNFDYIKCGEYDLDYSKENCGEIGKQYFFETINQKVYKKTEGKWQPFYYFSPTNNQIFGAMEAI